MSWRAPDWLRWTDRAGTAARRMAITVRTIAVLCLLSKVGATLLRPVVEDVLRVWLVDKKVGNFRNDGPELLEPLVPQEATLL
jgi:hypothetical protein